MIAIIVHKVSLPNTFSKTFYSVKDVISFMKERICNGCLVGGDLEDEDGFVYGTEPDITKTKDFRDFFHTACGCEYSYEIIDEE